MSDPIKAPCEKCGGLGEYDVPHHQWGSRSCPEAYVNVKCTDCEGTGKVEIEAEAPQMLSKKELQDALELIEKLILTGQLVGWIERKTNPLQVNLEFQSACLNGLCIQLNLSEETTVESLLTSSPA